MSQPAWVYACVAVSVLTVGTSKGQAQTAAEPPAKPAESSAGETNLPEVVVTTTDPPKAMPKATAKKAGSGGSAGAVTGAGKSETPSEAPQDLPQAETATGPFKGYAATQTSTGIKTDTPIQEIPQSISVVGAEQIRDQGANTLQEALHYVPGVIADGYGLDSRTDSIFVRGTEAAEYLDGLRRTFNYYVFNYRIDPYFMERIEVLRGPASVLYGQAPVGGIVDAISKRPQEEAYREITVEYGTYDWKQVMTDMTGKLTEDGKWLYRITGLARDADTQVDYVDDDRLAFAPAITYRPVAGTSITLLGHFRDDHTGSTAQFFRTSAHASRAAAGSSPASVSPASPTSTGTTPRPPRAPFSSTASSRRPFGCATISASPIFTTITTATTRASSLGRPGSPTFPIATPRTGRSRA